MGRVCRALYIIRVLLRSFLLLLSLLNLILLFIIIRFLLLRLRRLLLFCWSLSCHLRRTGGDGGTRRLKAHVQINEYHWVPLHDKSVCFVTRDSN